MRSIGVHLDELRAESPADRLYGIDALRDLCRAVETLPGLLRWLRRSSQSLDGDRLLELGDLREEWQGELYADLCQIERRRFPGLVAPLRAALQSLAHEGLEVFVDVGCGAMEVERQIAHRRRAARPPHTPIVMIGIDRSNEALVAAQRNLSEFQLDQIEAIDGPTLERLRNDADAPSRGGIALAFLKADAMSLLERLTPVADLVDVVFWSRFLHHLPASDKSTLEALATTRAEVVLDYDDLRGGRLFACLPAATAWNRPVLLIDALVSWLRDPTRGQVIAKAAADTNQQVTFRNPPGVYLRQIRSRKDP